MFTTEQINSLLDILKNQNLIFIGSNLGIDYLTADEISKLQSFGINPYHFYSPENDILQMSFHFGLLSDALPSTDAKKITYEDLVDYFKTGKFIPLTAVEKYSLDSIKKQTLSDIKSLEGRIFKDINNIISSNEKNNRAAYEAVIRDEILKGREQRKTTEAIARELGRKTGDWGRDFKKIVDFTSHLAFDEGRAAMFEEKHGKDVLVYKSVYIGCCKHCIAAYLTGGFGSEPKIFKLSILKANGSNIGRKIADWKPVVGGLHVYCRCTLNLYDPAYDWNKENKAFNIPKKDYKPVNQRVRNKIRVNVGGKEYLS